MPFNIEELTIENACDLLTSSLEENNIQHVEQLLAKFVTLNVQISDLHINLAIRLKDHTLLKNMLKIALLNKDRKSIYKLIQSGADVDLVFDANYETNIPIKFAIDQNDLELAELILNKDPDLISKHENIDFYPVSYAIGDKDCDFGPDNLSMIKLLLKNGGSPVGWCGPEINEDDTGPIEKAVIHNRKDILGLLIEYGGDNDPEYCSDYCPLSWAIVNNNPDMVDYLLKNLPNIATDLHQDSHCVSNTPIVLALNLEYWDIAQKLVQFELDRDSNIMGNELELKYFLDNLDAFRFMMNHFSFTDNAFDEFIKTLIERNSIDQHKETLQIISNKYDDFKSKLFSATVIADNVLLAKEALNHGSNNDLSVSADDLEFRHPEQNIHANTELGSALDYAIQNNLSNEMINFLYTNKASCIKLQQSLKHLIATNNACFYQIINLEARDGEVLNYSSLLNYAFLYDREEMCEVIIGKESEENFGIYYTEYKRHKLFEFISQHGSMVIDQVGSMTVSVCDKLAEIFSDCTRDFLTLLPIVNLVCLQETNTTHIDCFEHRSILKHLLHNRNEFTRHPLRLENIAPGSILTLGLRVGRYLQLNLPRGQHAYINQQEHPELLARRDQMQQELNDKWDRAAELADRIKQQLADLESEGPSQKRPRLG